MSHYVLNLCHKGHLKRTTTASKSRYFLRILTAFTCSVFVFVFYFVNGVQQQQRRGGGGGGPSAADVQMAAALEAAAVVPMARMGLGRAKESQLLLLPDMIPPDSPEAIGPIAPRTPSPPPPPPPQHGHQRCVRPVFWMAGRPTDYVVLYDFVQAEETVAYEDSVTYTTHATASFLNPHVANLAERWGGPVSVAVYVPTPADLDPTLKAIQQVRRCGHPSVAELVRRLVTFHLFFDRANGPDAQSMPCVFSDEPKDLNCLPADEDVSLAVNAKAANEKGGSSGQSKMTYPVNVARNIARITAQSRYVLPSDIELYPSEDLIPMFLAMIRKQKDGTASKANGATNATTTPPKLQSTSTSLPPTVYVLPLFEVDKSLEAPRNKSHLIRLLKQKKVVPFHKYVCPECHRVPKQEEWLKQVPSPNGTMSVLYSTKRHKPFQNWEPIYIGTNDEPLYDERLNWEGMSDKMTQAYEMCLMDYTFSILDNAFLVHAPGIKHYSKTSNHWRKAYVTENSKLRKQIKKELTTKHAPKAKCFL